MGVEGKLSSSFILKIPNNLRYKMQKVVIVRIKNNKE